MPGAPATSAVPSAGSLPDVALPRREDDPHEKQACFKVTMLLGFKNVASR